MTAICATCVNLHGTAKTDPWFRWMCAKAAVAPHMNFVVGKEMADPPYSWCRTINRDGECPEYEEGINCLSDEKLTQDKRKSTWTSTPRSPATT